MKIKEFSHQVDENVRKLAFSYLLNKVKSKGKEIKFGKFLTCQNYLMPNKILSLDEQRSIFKYQARMNKISDNFKHHKYIENCICGGYLDNSHLFECSVLNDGKSLNISYSQIFNGSLNEQKYIVNILDKNMEKLEEYTQAWEVS